MAVTAKSINTTTEQLWHLGMFLGLKIQDTTLNEVNWGEREKVCSYGVDNRKGAI